MKEVDLRYVFIKSEKDEEPSIYVKFSGFESEEQMQQFEDFLEENLPLLFFDSDVKH